MRSLLGLRDIGVPTWNLVRMRQNEPSLKPRHYDRSPPYERLPVQQGKGYSNFYQLPLKDPEWTYKMKDLSLVVRQELLFLPRRHRKRQSETKKGLQLQDHSPSKRRIGNLLESLLSCSKPTVNQLLVVVFYPEISLPQLLNPKEEENIPDQFFDLMKFFASVTQHRSIKTELFIKGIR